MGFDQAGYDCLFQVEWDKHCQQILARHWPNVPRWSDVQDVNGAELPPCDVLTFGSPCQDLSVAGKRAGIDGGRSSMFFEETRIIREMRNATGNTYPRVVVWENVPGALSSNRGEDFQAVLDEMANCGSHLTEWAVLDAQHFGVPQRRRRIFLVAVLDPATASRCPDPLLPVAEGRRGDYAKGIPTGEDIAGTLSGGSGSRGWSPDTDRMTFIPEVMLNFQGAKGSSITNQDDVSFTLNAMHGHDVHVVTTAVKAKRAMSNTDFDRWEETDLCPTLNAFDNGGESRATVIAFTAQRVGEAPRIYEDSTPALLSRMGTGGNNTPMVNQPIPIQDGREMEKKQNGLGIGAECDPSYTIDTTGGQSVAQPVIAFGWQEQFYAGDTHEEITTALTTTKTQAIHHPQHAVRRLTPLECERLMGWPDDHTRWKADGTEQADSHRYKQCGNGVATPVARWVAKQISQVLGG